MLAAAGLVAVVAVAGHAQLRAEAEVGGTRVSQANFPELSAATIQANADYRDRRFSIIGAGVVTQPASARTRLHSVLGAMVHTPLERRFALEAGAYGSAYDDGVFPVSRAGYLTARLHVRGDRAIAWVGGRHGALDDSLHRYPLTAADLGVATAWRGVQLVGTAAYHRTLGEPYIVFSERGDSSSTVRDRIAYTDIVVAPRREWGRLDLAARGGLRMVHRTVAFEPLVNQTHGSIEAAWWAAPRVAVVAAFGRELSDLSRGLPDSRYLTVGIRARLQGPARLRAQGSAPVARGVAGAAPDILVENGSAEGPRLRVLTGAGARSVEVAGTFNEWTPEALEPDGIGAWQLPIHLASGTHRVMVRVDGGSWVAPANVPVLEDAELGGRVGLITVP